MRKLSTFILLGVAVVILVGAVIAVSVDLPAPSEKVEKVIPDARLPH